MPAGWRALIVAVVVLLYGAGGVRAQMAWRWGRTNLNWEEAWAVATDNTGNVYTAANRTTNVYVLAWAKYSPDGTLLWADSAQGVNPCSIIDIASDREGNLFVFGFMNSSGLTINGTYLSPTGFHAPYFLVKFSAAGVLQWALRDGSVYQDPIATDIPLPRYGGIATDDSGNVYIVSQFGGSTMHIGSSTFTNTDTTGATPDVYMAKYTSYGALAWTQTAGGTGGDYGDAITVNTDGSIYITGQFASPSISFGSSTLVNTLDTTRVFIARYSTDATPLWAQAAGGQWGARGTELAHDDAGNIYLTGFFSDAAITFGAVTATPEIATPAQAKGFLVKYHVWDSVAWVRTVSGNVPAFEQSVACVSACGRVWISGGAILPGMTPKQYVVTAPGDSLQLPPFGDPVFLVCYDEAGNMLNDTSLPTGADDWADIACDGAGNVYLCADMEDGGVRIGPDSLGPAFETYYLGKYGFTPDTISSTSGSAFVCSTSSTQLMAPTGGYYLWDDGETTQARVVTTVGNYWVLVTGCSDTVFTDTFHVTLHAPPGPVSAPTAACAGSTFSCTDTTAGGIWTTSPATVASVNAVNGQVTTYGAGICTITYTAPWGCFAIATTTVSAPPAAGVIKGPAALCCNVNTQLTDSVAGGTWSSSNPAVATISGTTGAIEPLTRGSVTITYHIPPNFAGCSDSTMRTLPVDSLTLTHSVTNDVCDAGLGSITATADGGITPYQYQWSNSATGSTITGLAAGVYTVTASDSLSCSLQQTIDVAEDTCPPLVIHDVITPNGDGINDTWVIEGIADYPRCTVAIFDKWGNTVYEKTGYNNDWNGRETNGHELPDGTYFYLVKLNAPRPRGGKTTLTGAVLIKR